MPATDGPNTQALEVLTHCAEIAFKLAEHCTQHLVAHHLRHRGARARAWLPIHSPALCLHTPAATEAEASNRMGNCLSPQAYPEDTQWQPGQRDSRRSRGSKSREASAHESQQELQKKSVVQGLSPAYTVKHLLGRGTEGNTWLVEDVLSGASWAIKLIQMPLPPRLVTALFREIKLQSELGEGHPGIITPHEVVLTSHHLGLVMEYAPGGTLTQYVTQKYRSCRGVGLLMPEDEARYFFRQLVSAVDFCHRHHVAHRDLKLDNALLTEHNPPYLKICDFGFAASWGQDSHFSTVIGTPDYMSPQLTGAKATSQTCARYDGAKADVWAMGVLLCVMLIGRFPFEGKDTANMVTKDAGATQKVWLQQTKSKKWSDNELLHDQLPYMSYQARDLLERMFDLDEERRIDLAGIMEHPWFTTGMRPEYEEALVRLQQQQAVTARQLSRTSSNARREDAIKRLIQKACSDELRSKAAEPLTRDTPFQLWSRVGLRTVTMDRYCTALDTSTLSDQPSMPGPDSTISSDGMQYPGTVDSPSESVRSAILPTLQLTAMAWH